MIDTSILNKILNIGFSYDDISHTELGVCKTYSYYPEYFKEKHYDLVLFKYHYDLSVDYRLYVHKNSDGSFIYTPFQSSDISYVDKKLNEIFKLELLKHQRINKLNRILEE